MNQTLFFHNALIFIYNSILGNEIIDAETDKCDAINEKNHG